MSANILDGKQAAQELRHEVAARVTGLVEKTGKRPKLAVILVGDRKDSATYVRMKSKACEECGIEHVDLLLSDKISEEDLLAKVEGLNRDPTVNGILVQLPLPSHISERKVLQCVAVEKDVDGFHPEHIGRLGLKNFDLPVAVPCTPQGCLELLRRTDIPLAGKHAVVIGRSHIVGLPVSLLLLRADCTVTICHSRTVDIAAEVRRADIVVAAIGKPKFVQGDWIKPGAVVVDVGINPVSSTREDGTSTTKLVGDCDFDACKQHASWITPVPGGVGPMTIACLMNNTVSAFEKTLG